MILWKWSLIIFHLFARVAEPCFEFTRSWARSHSVSLSFSVYHFHSHFLLSFCSVTQFNVHYGLSSCQPWTAKEHIVTGSIELLREGISLLSSWEESEPIVKHWFDMSASVLAYLAFHSLSPSAGNLSICSLRAVKLASCQLDSIYLAFHSLFHYWLQLQRAVERSISSSSVSDNERTLTEKQFDCNHDKCTTLWPLSVLTRMTLKWFVLFQCTNLQLFPSRQTYKLANWWAPQRHTHTLLVWWLIAGESKKSAQAGNATNFPQASVGRLIHYN